MGYIKSSNTVTTFSCFYDEFSVKTGNAMVGNRSSSQAFSYYGQQTPGAINSEVFYDFYLSPGNYTFSILGITLASGGISSTYIDGVLKDTTDWYSAASVFNVFKTFTHTVTSNKKSTMSIVVASKNAASSSYVLQLTRIFAKLT